MQSFPYVIKPFETDIFGTVPPSMMMRISIYATSLKAVAEGLHPEWLFERLGAVWMLARIKVNQDRPVYEGEIELQVSSRSINGGTYIRNVNIVCGGVTAASAQIVFILVKLKERSIIRPAVLERELGCNDAPIELPPLKKVMLPQDMSGAGIYVVEYKECDSNGHLSSSNYADIICEHCGYWRGEQKIMRSLQIDFNTEFRPEITIEITTSVQNGISYMRGAHSSGKTGFAAVWKIE